MAVLGNLGDFYAHWQYVTNMVLVLVVTLAVALVVRYALRKLRTEDTDEHVWRNAMLGALNAPLRCLVWVVGISVAVGKLTVDGQIPVIADMFPPARNIVVVGLVAW